MILTLLGLPLGVLLRRKSIAVHADALGVLGVLRQNATNGRVIRGHDGKGCAFVGRSSSGSLRTCIEIYIGDGIDIRYKAGRYRYGRQVGI